jgi:asparagine synthase (glutamine-hydrolysing)
MCGIAGVVGAFKNGEDQSAIGAMIRSLHHRGPDDSGSVQFRYGDNVVAFGHTRLSILDLTSAGHQPMTDESGNNWITFNGEIYNFQELRKTLACCSSTFKTGTDTEVILRGYQRNGAQSFNALRGMFAFALLDRKNRKVLLARDPLGIKPLYYYRKDGKLTFASEVRALLASGQVPAKIAPQGMAHYLAHGWVGKSGTLIAGVEMLLPGQMLAVDVSGGEIQCTKSVFAEPRQCTENHSSESRSESAAHLRQILEESVRAHLVSDVPVGLFLSGGIDSAALLHLMSHVGQQPAKTFTVVFPDRELDEGRIAAQVAKLYGAEHQEIPLTDAELLAGMPAALAAIDQPTMDGINSYFISEAVRNASVKVALSGVGADELFGGYPSFRRALKAARIAAVPRSVRSKIAARGRRVLGSDRQQKFWDILSSECTAQDAYRASHRHFRPEEIERLFGSWAGGEESLEALRTDDPVNAVSRMELDGYMTDLLLRDTDFMSMSQGLEVRVPFVDRVVERYVLGLPGSWKINSSRPKGLLLDAIGSAIPEYVWNRRKMGFTLPFDRWMRTSLRAQIEEVFRTERLIERTGLSAGAVRQVWDRFLEGETYWSRPWSLFVLLEWCKRNGVTL